MKHSEVNALNLAIKILEKFLSSDENWEKISVIRSDEKLNSDFTPAYQVEFQLNDYKGCIAIYQGKLSPNINVWFNNSSFCLSLLENNLNTSQELKKLKDLIEKLKIRELNYKANFDLNLLEEFFKKDL